MRSNEFSDAGEHQLPQLSLSVSLYYGRQVTHESAELKALSERRVYLEDYCGRPRAAPFVPRERVVAVIERREPDRVPFGFCAIALCAARWHLFRCLGDASAKVLNDFSTERLFEIIALRRELS
jgi:hypothetical protein